MVALEGQPDAPYFLAAQVTDTRKIDLAAEDGALHGYAPTWRRRVDAEARIGSPALDSSHALRSGSDRGERVGRGVPLTDDVELLRLDIWRELEVRVRNARERWAKVTSDRTVLVDEEGGFDLAPVEPLVDLGQSAVLELDASEWEDPLRRASAVLATDHVVRDGQVRLTALAENYWFASTDGVRVRHNRVEYSIVASVDTIADDGTVIALRRRWAGHSPSALPSDERLTAGVAELHGLLSSLRVAPEQEPYKGPVLLTDRAAGVFFHEIFGHRMEGHRLKRVDNAQTFVDMVGKPILPSFLSVRDDPTTARINDIDLRGTYAYDDEGVPAQDVVLVDHGVLKGFLQSRSVVASGDLSNGHGRRQAGYHAVTRQGNLIVEASSSVTNDQLRDALVDEARRAGLDYALIIDDIQGGFTFTGRGVPNAFNVGVLVAWRVYVDGRPDELVRGVDLIGTPLVAFSQIILAGESHEVFNGSCGAESGWVPVSAVAPALLVRELETQRKAKGQRTPPLLPAPDQDGAAGVP